MPTGGGKFENARKRLTESNANSSFITKDIFKSVERAEYRMTQHQLADILGVSRQTIHAIENGIFVPSTVLALKIAKRFNKTVAEIFQLEDAD